MATAHNILVSVGANTTSFERSMNNMQRSMGSINDATQAMKTKMQDAFKAQDVAMQPLKQRMMEQKMGWFEMAEGMKTYSGTNAQFMTDVEAMGKADKAIKDEMMANNSLMSAGFITGVGAMLARSTTSSKIAENFDRINNPLYRVNNGLLRVTGGLEGIAKRGAPAVMALKMLGPTANMKKLADQTRLISTGMMRFQSVAVVAGIATGLIVKALHGSAMENEEYADSFNTMVSKVKEAFQPMVDVFTEIMPYIYDAVTAVAELAISFNEAHPFVAKLIQGFLLLIPILMLILSPLAIGIGLFNGMTVAFASLAPFIMPLITGLGAMSGTVFLVAGAIVALIAVGVLLYKNWDTIVAWLGKAWTAIKATAISVWDGLKEFFAKWGTTILAVITGPIGILILLISRNWDTIKAKTAEAWEGIKNLFQSAIDGVINIAKKLLQFFLNYTPLGFVVKTIIKNWGEIKQAFTLFGEMIKGIWTVIWNAIKNFLTPIFSAIKNALTTAWNAIKNVTSTVFNAVKGVITSIWNNIKSVVSTVINAVLAVVRTAWNNLKNNTTTIFNGIKSVISSVVNSIKGVVGRAFDAVKTAMTGPIDKAKEMIRKALDAIKSLFSGLKLKIPMPKIPKISVSAGSKTVAGVSIPYPKFDVGWYAKGGVFNGASVIGVGEKGSEAVVPLNGNRMKPFAREIAGQMPQAEGGNGGFGGDIILHLDGKEVARVTAPYMNSELRNKRDSTSRAGGRF